MLPVGSQDRAAAQPVEIHGGRNGSRRTVDRQRPRGASDVVAKFVGHVSERLRAGRCAGHGRAVLRCVHGAGNIRVSRPCAGYRAGAGIGSQGCGDRRLRGRKHLSEHARVLLIRIGAVDSRIVASDFPDADGIVLQGWVGPRDHALRHVGGHIPAKSPVVSRVAVIGKQQIACSGGTICKGRRRVVCISWPGDRETAPARRFERGGARALEQRVPG